MAIILTPWLDDTGAMRIFVTDTREDSTRQHEFHDSAVSIGADSANILQLPSIDLPPYLAMLMPSHEGEHESWTYLPVDPSAVAMLGSEPLRDQHRLLDGDEITIDRFVLRIEFDLADELELPEPSNLEALQKIKKYPLPPRSETQRPEDFVTLSPKRFELLARFGVKLGGITDFAHLLEETLSLLLDTIGARKVWMGIRRKLEGPLVLVDGRTVDGKHPGDPPMLETFLYRCLTRRQFIRISRPTDRTLRSVIAIPILGLRAPMGLMYADTARGQRGLGADPGRGYRKLDTTDLDFMTMLASMVAAQVESIAEGLEAQHVRLAEGQMAFLREVQSRLDPTNVPMWSGLQVAAYAKPGLDRAGDIYDITRLPNGLASLLVGHVKAEPTRAAMVMTEIRSAFRIASLHADPPHIQLKALSWLLRDEKHPCLVDCLVLMVNPKTGAVEYSLAGDVGAIVVERGGEVRAFLSPDVPPIGASKNAGFERLSERIRIGDSLGLFSAGCAAARDAESQVLGRERFVDAVGDGFDQPAAAALDGLLADLAGFLKNGEPPDDITILYLHRVVTAV